VPATLKSNKIVAALQFAAKAGCDVDAALDQLTELTELANKAPAKASVVLTEFDTSPDGKPRFVAWSNCGTCHLHVLRCNCTSGPTMPPYIARWVETHEAELNGLSTSVSSPKSAKPSFPAEGVPDSGETAIPPAQTEAGGVPLATGPSCNACGRSVEFDEAGALSNADRNDDDTYTCFECQEGGK